MSKLKTLFKAGTNLPVKGIGETELKSTKLLSLAVHGNDKTHNSASGPAAL